MFHLRKIFYITAEQPESKRKEATLMPLWEACDSAEICKLIGIFMLSLTEQTYYSKEIILFTIPFIIFESLTKF